MVNFWNNIMPSSVTFHITPHSNYGQPPVNAANPNWQLQPGARPALPAPAIPANPGNIKAALNKLPTLFNINHGQ